MHEQKIARALPGASLRQENLKQENISLAAAHGSFTYNRQGTTHTHKLLISQASISHKSEQTAHTHTHTIMYAGMWRLTSITFDALCRPFLKSDSNCASFLCEADPQIGSRDLPHVFLLLNGEINLINLPSGNGLWRDEQADS